MVDNHGEYAKAHEKAQEITTLLKSRANQAHTQSGDAVDKASAEFFREAENNGFINVSLKGGKDKHRKTNSDPGGKKDKNKRGNTDNLPPRHPSGVRSNPEPVPESLRQRMDRRGSNILRRDSRGSRGSGSSGSGTPDRVLSRGSSSTDSRGSAYERVSPKVRTPTSPPTSPRYTRKEAADYVNKHHPNAAAVVSGSKQHTMVVGRDMNKVVTAAKKERDELGKTTHLFAGKSISSEAKKEFWDKVKDKERKTGSGWLTHREVRETKIYRANQEAINDALKSGWTIIQLQTEMSKLLDTSPFFATELDRIAGSSRRVQVKPKNLDDFNTRSAPRHKNGSSKDESTPYPGESSNYQKGGSSSSHPKSQKRR